MILYIGNYRDKYPYGSFAMDNILSLQKTGEEIVCRPVNPFGNLLEQKLELKNIENKKLENIDVIIQHVSPNFYETKNGVKNIGFLEHNQIIFKRFNWPQCCNLMDEIWVTCADTKVAAIESGVTIPIKIVKHGREIDKNIQYNDIQSDINDKCIFYSIFENNRLNNITGLIRAYYYAFNKNDDVTLLLTPYNRHHDTQKILNEIQTIINDLKKACNIYKNPNDYPQISININKFDQKNIYKIHDISHIYVSCDRGLPWNIFAHEAMLFGNPAIASKVCSNKEILGEYGLQISGQNIPCVDIISSGENSRTGKDLWFDPNLSQFAHKMRTLYNLWEDKKLKILFNPAIKYVKDFNYENIGKLMKENL